MNKVNKVLLWIRAINVSVHSTFGRIDSRTLIGAGLLWLGVFIIRSPDVGSAQHMANFGVSPFGFGIVSVICGGVILRYPQSDAFLLLAMPMIFYAIFFINYMLTLNEVLSPVVMYILALLYIFKEASTGAGDGRK